MSLHTPVSGISCPVVTLCVPIVEPGIFNLSPFNLDNGISTLLSSGIFKSCNLFYLREHHCHVTLSEVDRYWRVYWCLLS
jgi:hypothetical protein